MVIVLKKTCVVGLSKRFLVDLVKLDEVDGADVTLFKIVEGFERSFLFLD